MKRSELVAAATELNDVLGLKPAINVKGNASELTDALSEASTLINKEEDELSEETWRVINNILGVVPTEEKEPEPKVEIKKAPQEKIKKAPQEKIKVRPKAKVKPSPKPEIVQPEKAPEPKKSEDTTYKRAYAIADTLSENAGIPTAPQEIIELAEQKYSKFTGKEKSIKGSHQAYYRVATTLKRLGVLQQNTDGKVHIPKSVLHT